MKRLKLVSLPYLYDADGDMSKKWFVSYSVNDPRTGKMKRFKTHKGLNKIKVTDKRYAFGLAKVNEITTKLKNGWNPFTDDSEFIYEDQLKYKHIKEIHGEMRSSNMIFRFYANKYLEGRTKIDKTSTLPDYQSKLRTFSEWIEATYGEVDASSITNHVVLRFFTELLIGKRKSADRTIKCYKQIISSVFDTIVDDGRMMKNPVFNIPQGYEKDEAPRPIADFDIKRFRDKISSCDPQLWMAIEFETYCFLRPGKELRLLKIRDIDFARGLINVDRFRAKTNRDRFATIPEHFLKKLRDQYKLHHFNKDFYVLGREYKPGPENLGKNNLKNRFNNFREILDMPDVYKLYSWKHTGNSLALDSDISMYDLRDQNGHSSIQTTEIYTKNKLGKVSRDIRDKFPSLDKM